LSGDDGRRLANLLSAGLVARIERSGFPEVLWGSLESGGFIVDDGADEVGEIKERFWAARVGAPIVVTLTVTQDCNLRCFYCYEDRTSDRLDEVDIDRILERLDQSIARQPERGVHVDWYGGEPLLNAEFIETASRRIQEHVAARGRKYSASVISNGTRWPDDPVGFVRRHNIREVQISFDGDREQHNKYRAYREGEGSSFDEAVRVVDSLASVCKVSVRLNLDARSVRSLDSFLDFACGRGWFARPNKAVLQPARLAPFSKRVSFMKDAGLSVTEFEAVKASIKRRVGNTVRIEEAETTDAFPHPRRSVCAALAENSFVIGADSLEYRCGLQVGEHGRAIASLAERRRLPIAGGVGNDADFWRTFDPTTRERCRRCSFLPICWGGCPKGHLEGNQHAIDEQGRYWRENLARLIASGAGEELAEPQHYDDGVQFRRSLQ